MAYINGKKVFFSPKVIIKTDIITVSTSETYRGYKNYQVGTEVLDVTKSYTLWVGTTNPVLGFEALENQTPTNNKISYENNASGACVDIYFNKSYDGENLIDKAGCICVYSKHLADEDTGTDYYITLK